MRQVSKFTTGIIKDSTSKSYEGPVDVFLVHDGLFKCDYHLTNKEDPVDNYAGSFECNSSTITMIIKRLTEIVNQNS